MRKTLFVLTVASALPSTLYAQVPENVLTEQSPSRIEERLSPEFRGDSRQNVEIPLIEGMPEQEETLAEDKNAPTFAVQDIVFEGNTVFSGTELQENVQTAIGQDVTLAKLKQAAVNITNKYRREGYPFTKAFVPKQTLAGGKVKIEVIEGYVGEVEFRGVAVPEGSFVNDYAETLKAQRPVRQIDLERYTLLINDLPGVSARAIMSLIKDQPGAVKLTLLIDENQNEVGFGLNNRGSDSIGPIQTSAFYKGNNLLGRNEQTVVTVLSAPIGGELNYMSFFQVYPIGDEGAKIAASYRRSDSNPGAEAEPFDIEGQSNSYSVKASYPLIRAFDKNWNASIGFDSINSSTESFDVEIIEDHIRTVTAETSFNAIHDKGNTSAQLAITQGLDILDATQGGDIKASRAGRSTATKLNAKIGRTQVVTDDLVLNAKASAQWAFDPLLSNGLFAVGGSEYGRAFDFSTITGDHGYATSLELRHKVDHNIENMNRLDVFGFVDYGQTYDETHLITQNWETLSSAGAGVEIGLYDLVGFNFEIAKPLKVDVAGTEDHNVNAYANLSFRKKF